MNVADQSSYQSNTSNPPRSILTRNLLLAFTYCLLVISLTWPTISQITTHLPGDGGDDPAIAWNLWWIKYALLNQGQSPFISDFMFYPIGINLAFYTLTVLNGVTALPLTLNFGVVAASNIHMFFTFVVGGYGTFLLTRYILVTTLFSESLETSVQRVNRSRLIWLSAAIAGGFYAFASSKLFYVVLGQFNIASTHWIPLTILYLFKTHQQPRRLKNPLMTGLFFTCQAWAELTYASFILIFMGLFWLYQGGLTLFRSQAVTALRLLGRNIIIIGAICTLGLTPILAYMLPDMLTEGDFLVEGGGFADTFSADLLGFIIPTMHHPFLAELVTLTSIRNYTLGQHIYLGVVLLGLLAVAIFNNYRRPAIWFWIAAIIIFGLLSLGPAITINGQVTPLAGPFVLLQQLPFFKGNRYPSRYSVMLILSLSVVVGFALTWLGQRLTRQFPGKAIAPMTLLLIGGLFVFEHLSLPLPQSDMRVPPLYQTIATQPDSFTVLDIPFAWRNGFRVTGAQTTQFMFGQFYQTDHQKRHLQGNTSRNPKFKFQYFTQAPVINSLLALETGKSLPSDRWESDRAIAAEVLNFFDIRYIVVRPYQYEYYSVSELIVVSPENVIDYIEQLLPVEKIYDEAGSKLYQVIEPDNIDSNVIIETGSPLAPLYFGEGWGLVTPNQPITAQRRQVRLLLPLQSAEQQITIRTRLPDEIATPTRSMTLAINGWRSEAQTVTQEWQDLTFSIPAGIAITGLNNVWLHFDAVSTLSSDPPIIDVTVQSAGEEVGKFGHIFINGFDISPNKTGYNLAIIPPQEPPLVAHFDTHFDQTASNQLAQTLHSESWPTDIIIAIAVADEASRNLSEEAVTALQSLGSQSDLRDCFRCSHAFITQVGSNIIYEGFDPIGPVNLTTNLGLTEPTIAATINTISIKTP